MTLSCYTTYKIFYKICTKNLGRKFLGEVPLKAVLVGEYVVQSLFHDERIYTLKIKSTKIHLIINDSNHL